MTEETARPGVDEMFCTTCGKIINKQAEICPHCGVRVRPAPVTGSQFDPNVRYSEKSRIVAGVLGIVLGGLGIHRFYLGNIGLGIVQIIVSIITLGIGSIWGFIEGIIIIAGANWKDSEGLPLRPYN